MILPNTLGSIVVVCFTRSVNTGKSTATRKRNSICNRKWVAFGITSLCNMFTIISKSPFSPYSSENVFFSFTVISRISCGRNRSVNWLKYTRGWSQTLICSSFSMTVVIQCNAFCNTNWLLRLRMMESNTTPRLELGSSESLLLRFTFCCSS